MLQQMLVGSTTSPGLADVSKCERHGKIDIAGDVMADGFEKEIVNAVFLPLVDVVRERPTTRS
jgi:hypothetical protein